MNEQEPKYITKLKDDLISHFDKKIEEEVGSLAASTAEGFRAVDARFREVYIKFQDIESRMATKDDLKDLMTKAEGRELMTKEEGRELMTKEDGKEILNHIGRYEIRSRNIEEILLQDHKPRIIDLEKEVFKIS